MLCLQRSCTNSFSYQASIASDDDESLITIDSTLKKIDNERIESNSIRAQARGFVRSDDQSVHPREIVPSELRRGTVSWIVRVQRYYMVVAFTMYTSTILISYAGPALYCKPEHQSIFSKLYDNYDKILMR